MTYRIEDHDFSHFVTWQPENEPEAVRLEVHPEAPLKGDALDALTDALVAARSAVEQSSVKARHKAFTKAGYKSGR